MASNHPQFERAPESHRAIQHRLYTIATAEEALQRAAIVQHGDLSKKVPAAPEQTAPTNVVPFPLNANMRHLGAAHQITAMTETEQRIEDALAKVARIWEDEGPNELAA